MSTEKKCPMCHGHHWINFAPNDMGYTGACCPVCNHKGEIPEVPGAQLETIHIAAVISAATAEEAMTKLKVPTDD